MKTKGKISYSPSAEVQSESYELEQSLIATRELEESRRSLNDRLNNCPSISKEDQDEPDFEYVR